MKPTFATRLTNWRDRCKFTNTDGASIISNRIGFRVQVRTFENWIQGRDGRAVGLAPRPNSVPGHRLKKLERTAIFPK